MKTLTFSWNLAVPSLVAPLLASLPPLPCDAHRAHAFGAACFAREGALLTASLVGGGE